MVPGTDYLLVFNTCPDADTARRLATHLVDNGLAACVNIIPGVTSVYRWKGKTETEQEYLLSMKSTIGRYPELEQAITAQHPYELPEIVAVPIDAGLEGYLSWVGESCLEKK